MSWADVKFWGVVIVALVFACGMILSFVFAATVIISRPFRRANRQCNNCGNWMRPDEADRCTICGDYLDDPRKVTLSRGKSWTCLSQFGHCVAPSQCQQAESCMHPMKDAA